MIYRWQLNPPQSKFNDGCAVPDSLKSAISKKIYKQRFCNPEAGMSESYFGAPLSQLRDPSDLPELEAGAEYLHKHLSQNGSICIFADYDVDGICGGILVYQFLKTAYPDHNIQISHSDRFSEGYGLHLHHVDRLLDFNCILTVDCGSNSLKATQRLTESGCDVIITDHHECALDQEGRVIRPNAKAFINPKRQDAPHYYSFLSGTGVALMLCLVMRRISPACASTKLSSFLDLVCTSIISDSVPLVNENRLIVQYGLKVFNTMPRPFFRTLMDAPHPRFGPVDENTLSFALIPKLNAPGRLGSTEPIVGGLLSEDQESIEAHAKTALAQNKQRMEIQQNSWMLVEPLIDESKNVICVYHSKIHEGVIGILASRIAEKTHKPSIVLCPSQNPDEIKGSGRSYDGRSVFDIASHFSGHFKQFGGHQAAIGLTLPRSNLDAFRNGINDYVLPEKPATLAIDDEILMDDITLQTAMDIQKIGPYGQQFEEPIFLLKDVAIPKLSLLKENHLKGILESRNKKRVEFLGWKLGYLSPHLSLDHRYDVVLRLRVNHYQNIRRVQCEILDFEPIFKHS